MLLNIFYKVSSNKGMMAYLTDRSFNLKRHTDTAIDI